MGRSLHVVLLYVTLQLGLIFFMYPEDIIGCADEGHWVPIMTGFALHVLFMAIYMKGLSYAAGRGMVDMYLRLGRPIAAVLLLPVFVFFMAATVITLRAYSEIIGIVFLSNTPVWAIMLFLFAVSFWLANLGIRAIAHTALLIACVCLPLILFIFVVSFQSVDWRYAVPLVDTHYTFWREAAFYKSLFAYAGVFLFLGFVQPHFDYRIRHVLWAAVGLVPLFLFAVYIPLMTFGDSTASTFFFPFIVTLDMININWLMFERVTIFFLMSLLTFVILFMAVVLWQSAQMITKFYPKARNGWIVTALAVVVFLCGKAVQDWNQVEQLLYWNTWTRWYIMAVVPLTVYALGRKMRKEASHAG